VERTIEVPARIAGDRVLLRPLEPGDAEPWAAAFADDPDLGPAWGIDEDPGEEELRERIEGAGEWPREGRGLELAIADRTSDELLGTVILHSIDWRHERAEVGFWLKRGARGQGAAAEAVGLMVAWAFDDLGLHRIEMITLPALPNFPRVLALAKRLGFRQEGVMRERNFERGVRRDTMMLARLRDD
jgi:ribosomal-protein-alanine N-acetyltransferase